MSSLARRDPTVKLAVVLGMAGGWAGTRTLVGQSALSTSLISPGAASPASAMKAHVDSPNSLTRSARTAGPATTTGTGSPEISIRSPPSNMSWE